MTEFQAVWSTDEGSLSSHADYIADGKAIMSVSALSLGDVIACMYKGKPRFGFVMHPDFNGKMHVLDLKNIDRDTLIHMIVPRLYTVHDPLVFYETVYKNNDVLYQSDSYRTYLADQVTQIVRFVYDITDYDIKDIQNPTIDDDS